MPTVTDRYKLINCICLSNQIEIKATEEELLKICYQTEGYSHRDMRNVMEKAFQVKKEIILWGIQLLPFRLGLS